MDRIEEAVEAIEPFANFLESSRDSVTPEKHGPENCLKMNIRYLTQNYFNEGDWVYYSLDVCHTCGETLQETTFFKDLDKGLEEIKEWEDDDFGRPDPMEEMKRKHQRREFI